MPAIKHVFVLMLENRSFDHMLGFSEISGIDAENGQKTSIERLTGRESNSFNGTTYSVSPTAPSRVEFDPSHEFPDVLEQLCGSTATYPKGPPPGPYPPINNSGFLSNHVKGAAAKGKVLANPGEVMLSFAPENLPVINTLARQFAVCDHWYCSIPGPTWPNRFFALAASSGGLDRSQTLAESGIWETIRGFRIQNGSIFDRGLNWRIYAGNILTAQAHALKGIHITDIQRYSTFARDLADPDNPYPAQFTWIEPNYGNVISGSYKGGTSQHPLDGIAGGETLIKQTYESIRNSPIWDSSLLIVTWDEHGGFYDHVAPLPAEPPGDKQQMRGVNKYGFDFKQYGPRVLAVIISPLIKAGTIDHRTYDHSSIPATVESIFSLAPMTQRDARANNLLSLVSLPTTRADAPTELPGVVRRDEAAPEIFLDSFDEKMTLDSVGQERADELVESDRSLPGYVYLLARSHWELSHWSQFLHVLFRRRRVKTRRDASEYFEDIRKLAGGATR